MKPFKRVDKKDLEFFETCMPGRVVYQELTRITRAIRDGSFFKNEALFDT